MSDLGKMTYFLGLDVNQAHNAIFIKQKGFAMKILRRYSMENCKPAKTPIAQSSRPNIMFVVSLLSRFIHCCTVNHYKAAKRALRYIRGTLDHGVKFMRTEKIELLGYSDSDWAGSSEDMKSTSSYIFTLGSSVFCWSSKKQETVARSTTEAEYVVASTAVNQAICSQDRLVDTLTKPLGKMRFEKMCYDIGVQSIEVKEECCEMTIHANCELRAHQDCELTCEL
ncbi:hypothetical protein CXB51_024200 [Gossypium anomalum]|uniref:Reverse transcriptase Ty1/copia-type domain-containing protein n=1 Tax=Gossypium anomalum TaxID=47600 RepID=A0A8J5YQ19_9ROSI|nr:hypothetical protein CXB51_024200 [Gossypium anomalum]